MTTEENAFERWRAPQPFRGATDRERAAFLAGFRAATNPIKTRKQLNEMLVNELKRISNEENSTNAQVHGLEQSRAT